MKSLPILERIVTITDAISGCHLSAGETEILPSEGDTILAYYFEEFKFDHQDKRLVSGIPFRRLILSKGHAQHFGLYRFEVEGSPHYMMRTASGLWFKKPRVRKSHGKGFYSHHPYILQRGWRTASVFRFAQLGYTFTFASGPMVPDEEGQRKFVIPPAHAICVINPPASDARTGTSLLDLQNMTGDLNSGKADLFLEDVARGDAASAKSDVYTFDFRGRAVFPDVTTVKQIDQTSPAGRQADDTVDGYTGGWAEIGARLKAKTVAEFPTVLRDHYWDRLNGEQRAAQVEILRLLAGQGVPAGQEDAVDLSRIQRFHVSRALLDIRGGATLAHHHVAEILNHYLDIRDAMYGYIDQARDFVQASFSVQDSTLDEVMGRLNIVSDNVEENDADAIATVFSYVSALASVPGAAVPQIGALVSVLNLALQIAADLRNDPSSGVDLSNTGLVSRGMDIKSRIRNDFLALGTGLDQARQVLSADTGALEIWRDANPVFVNNTMALKGLTDGAFRSHCWTQLLPVGCQIKAEKIDDLQVLSSGAIRDGEPHRWVRNYINTCRVKDPAIIGATYYGDQVYYKDSELYNRVVYVRYRLLTRTGGLLGLDTVRELMVTQGFTPQRLAQDAGISVNEDVELHSMLDNAVFTRSNTQYCDRTAAETSAIASLLSGR